MGQVVDALKVPKFRSKTDSLVYSEQDDPNKFGKSQGTAECSLTRSTLERGCQARRAARRLRDHHHHHRHHHHHHKLPSNLDILELHTLEVLKRLEVGQLEEVRDALCPIMHCSTERKFHLHIFFFSVMFDMFADLAACIIINFL